MTILAKQDGLAALSERFRLCGFVLFERRIITGTCYAKAQTQDLCTSGSKRLRSRTGEILILGGKCSLNRYKQNSSFVLNGGYLGFSS